MDEEIFSAYEDQKLISQSRPGRAAVKFVCSASVAWGWQFWIWHRPTHCLSSHAVVGIPHIKNRGRWAQMLALGQSSSANRGGLAVDVSSRIIFLKTKKNKLDFQSALTSELSSTEDKTTS